MSFSDKMILPHRRPRFRSKLRQFFAASIREDLLLEVELLFLAFATGIGDSTTYSEYRVFTSNHTGNTLLLSVYTTESWGGVSEVKNVVPVPIQLIALSLSMFMTAAWISGQVGHLVGSRRRWWLISTNFFQFLLVIAASLVQASIGGWDAPSRHGTVDISVRSGCVVALLAFSSGGQVAVVRSLRIVEITTANATSAYVDLLIDKRMFQAHNRGRNRRLCFLGCLVLGSFVGGYIYQIIGSPKTLFISGMIKLIPTLLLFFNRGGYYNTSAITRVEDGSLQTTSVNNPEFCYEEKATSPIIHPMSYKDQKLRPTVDAYPGPRHSEVLISLPSWIITTVAYGY